MDRSPALNVYSEIIEDEPRVDELLEVFCGLKWVGGGFAKVKINLNRSVKIEKSNRKC